MDQEYAGQVRLVEEIAMNAWPAETIQIVDGWRMRFNHGITRRTNSVWPNAWGGLVPLAVRMQMVEDFYARRGLPARYQITPAQVPEGLDEILESQGYEIEARTHVQISPIEKVLDLAGPHGACRIIEGADEGWFRAYARAEGFDEKSYDVRWATISRTGPRHAYALLSVDGEDVAVGRAVLERGWVGIFGMSTHPDHRRRGYATTVLRTLADWGRREGAVQMYLQVESHNLGAQALYGRLGFEGFYDYYYRSLFG